MTAMRQIIALAAVLASSTANAQYTDGTIKIGVLTDMSSLYADIGGSGAVAAAKVATSADVTSDPQLLARRYWHNVPHAEMGWVLVNLPPFRAVGEERVAPGPPPLLGEHTVEVASELLGFDQAECRRLMDEKVFY